MAAHTKDRWHEPKPLSCVKLDRRSSHRFAAIGVLEALWETADDGGERVALSLIDESDRGAGANVDLPLPPGARLRVLSDPMRGTWRRARVVRCVPTKRGYRVGLLYEQVQAQAA